MNKHQKIIGTLSFSVGILVFSFISSMLLYNFYLGYVENVIWNALFLPASIGLMISGHSLQKNTKNAYAIALTTARVNLFNFPLGLIVSVYYLWFHYRFVKNKI